MAANKQVATAKINEGHFPHAFTQALQDDPGAITQAYVYAVTVSGKQSIRWKGSARRRRGEPVHHPRGPVPTPPLLRPGRRHAVRRALTLAPERR